MCGAALGVVYHVKQSLALWQHLRPQGQKKCPVQASMERGVVCYYE